MVTGTHRAGRSRRWLLPVAVLLVWVFVGGPLSSFAGQLGSIQENDNAAFLPQSAESTRALEKLVRFQDEDTLPAVVVAERDGGLTADDTALLQRYAGELADVPGLAASGVTGPIPSADGEAAQLVVNLDARDGDALLETVGKVRDVVADPPAGLTVLVGGQGGILGDFIEAFGAIDGILLVVALLVVLVILLVVYRTPVLPLVVILSSVLALGVASAAVYGLARADVLDVNGQSQGILFILAIGAATDYSLLVVSRFREELRDHESRFTAMGRALRASWEPVVASGLTVVLGLLCLLLSDLSSLAGLGPVGALGIVGAVLASLTLLPAMLVLLGRAAFWPFMPAYGSEHRDDRGVWGRVARLVGRRAPAVAVVTALVLGVLAAFITTLDEDPVPQTELFLTEVDSVRAQEVLDAHFESDSSSPVQVVVPAARLQETVALLQDHPGIARPTDRTPTVFALPASPEDPTTPKVVDGEAVVLATLDAPGDSAAATRTLELLRTDLHTLDDDVLVGGSTAILVDTRDTTQRDRAVVIPAILLVILVVLALLLRSLVAPLLLILANVLSFGATMGVSALVFEHVFDYPASDPSTSLIAFVFLVALGIDYSIFLMTRVREESLRRGTRPGILKGLSVTGGVITSAGVVLAATFTALGVIPILFLAQIAFIVAFGVLLDALVVRSLLVPALCHWIGPGIWWPSRLARRP
ncbi:MMPL family transporter [Nocardioides aurantiacus]|uniref:RND superfamily putative drug exporter n=1 Tax=Nocardioides aurantiacus TaxID=86796 RepID=A0A3N2CR90_9ACTN|nr:MMPL family transporter [Nocardioides aurantiacus]ROR90055.1 RND superfamily putative drug exporter [Nocardioides aurantiacus]